MGDQWFWGSQTQVILAEDLHLPCLPRHAPNRHAPPEPKTAQRGAATGQGNRYRPDDLPIFAWGK